MSHDLALIAITAWLTAGVFGSIAWNLIEADMWRWAGWLRRFWWLVFPVPFGVLTSGIVFFDLAQKFVHFDDED